MKKKKKKPKTKTKTYNNLCDNPRLFERLQKKAKDLNDNDNKGYLKQQ